MTAVRPVAREVVDDLSPAGWDRRLVAPGPEWRLRLLHLTLLASVGLRLATGPWRSLADRVPEMFEPVFVLAWLDGPPGRGVVLGAWCLGLGAVAVGCFSVWRGWPTRGPLAVAWVSLLFLAGLWGSGGKVLHNDVLLLTVVVPVLLGPSVRRRHRRAGEPADSVAWGWPPRAALAVLGTVYLLTGYQKLRHSGLDWVLSENLRWVLRQGTPRAAADLVHAVADRLWLTQAMAAGALLLELAAPALLAVRRTRLWFPVAVTVMHGSIWLAIGIDYWAWVAAAWAVVLPSTRAGARLATLLRLRRPEVVDASDAPDREVAAT